MLQRILQVAFSVGVLLLIVSSAWATRGGVTMTVNVSGQRTFSQANIYGFKLTQYCYRGGQSRKTRDTNKLVSNANEKSFSFKTPTCPRNKPRKRRYVGRYRLTVYLFRRADCNRTDRRSFQTAQYSRVTDKNGDKADRIRTITINPDNLSVGSNYQRSFAFK